MTYYTKTLALILLTIMTIQSAKSQNKNSDQLKNIKTLYPDKKFYAIKEEISYEFDIKDNKLNILEEFNSILVSPEYNNQRFHSVFYDDYSEVKKVSCNAEGQVNPQLNVIYTNYESNGIFHDDLKLCAFKMEMDKDIQYKVKYEKLYKNPRFFTRVFFHENYPIAEKVLKFKIPNWVNVEIKPINFESYNIIVETEKNDSKNKTVTYTIKNANSTPNENHAPSILKYLPHLLIFIKSHNNGQQLEKYFNNQDDVYAWNHILSNTVENREKELLPILNNIIKDEKDSLKMMEKVFYWVQDNVRYIAFEEGIMGYKPAPAEKVCNLLYGDCKGMANLTKTLLKLAGFEARLTWIGTDNIPYDNNLPTLAVYNHMICTVIFREKKYFLDATESYIALNDYAERIQNRPCMIECGGTYLNEKIPNLNFERNLQEEKIEFKIENNQLIGKSKNIYSGEVKTSFLRRFNEMRSSNIELALKNNFTSTNPNLIVENIKTSDINDRANQLIINYDLTLKNSIIKGANNQLYVFMIKDHDLAQLYFDSTRVCDYEFNLKYFISDIYSLECPAGFKLDRLPKTLEIDNSIFAFSLGYEVKENKVTLKKTIKIKSGSIGKKDFNSWNEAITQARNFYNSPVVLTQK
jgi:hypothetical protein